MNQAHDVHTNILARVKPMEKRDDLVLLAMG